MFPEFLCVEIRLSSTGCESDKNLLSARPPVLSAARVKENCFSFSFIVAPACESWRMVSTNNKCRVFDGFAPAPEAWTGGSGRAARQCASSSATGGQTGPEEAGAGQKPAFKPAWKTTDLSRLAHSRNWAWGRRPGRARRCRDRARPVAAVWPAGRARHRGGEGSSRSRTSPASSRSSRARKPARMTSDWLL